MGSCKEVWNEFFKRYYWEQILGLANQYPDTKSLWIEFGNLERFDMELARELLDFPDGVIRHATESLRGLDLPADTEITEAHVRIEHLPELTPIRDIRSTNINKLIAVTGLVRKATEVRPKVTNAAFKCARCGDITYLKQEEYAFDEPFECGNDACGRKGPFKLVPGESDFIDFQKIRIQDSPDEVRPGEQPQTLDASVVEDITGQVSPGDRVVIVGILRSYQRVTQQGKSTAFDLILETVSIEAEEKGFEEIEVTKEGDRINDHHLSLAEKRAAKNISISTNPGGDK